MRKIVRAVVNLPSATYIYILADETCIVWDEKVLYTIPMNINGYIPILINTLHCIVRGNNMLTTDALTLSPAVA